VKTDKIVNLALLARHLGMLNDKLQAADQLDLTKLSNETIAMMRRDLCLADGMITRRPRIGSLPHNPAVERRSGAHDGDRA